MNISLFRVLAVIAGVIAFVITLLLMKPMLSVLHSSFPATNAPDSTNWRTAVTVTNAAIFFILYALFGALFGYLRPESKWKRSLWLAISSILLAVIILVFAGIEYPTTLIVGVVSGVAGGSLGAQSRQMY
jgi:tetrahydromethanopterin S-methyltransferase subunit C